MKRIFYSTTAIVISAAMLMSSCKSDNRLASESIPVTPASISQSEYTEFKEWKQQQMENTYKTTTAAKTQRPVVVHKHYTVNKTTPAVATTTKKKKGWSKA